MLLDNEICPLIFRLVEFPDRQSYLHKCCTTSLSNDVYSNSCSLLSAQGYSMLLCAVRAAAQEPVSCTHTHPQDRGTLFIRSTLHSLSYQTVCPTDVPSEANGQQGTTGVPHSKNYPLHHSDHSAFTNHLHVHTPNHLLWSVFALLEARLEGVQLLPERKNLLLLLWKGVYVGKSGIHLLPLTVQCWIELQPKTCLHL